MLKKLLVAAGILAAILVLASVALRLWLRSDAIRATIESQATAALGMPVRIGSARAVVLPRLRLDLQDVAIGEPARASLNEVSITTGLELIFSRRVEGADVRLTGGTADASLLAGIAAAPPSPSSGPDAPPSRNAAFTIVSIRSIRLREVDLVAGTERLRTSLDAALAGDRLEVSSLTARVGEATLQIQGQMSSLAAREGHFDVKADLLPVDVLSSTIAGLSAGSRSNQNVPQEISSSPFRITATISAPVVTVGTRRLNSFEGRLEATGAGLVLDPVTFGVDTGRVEARLAVDPSADTPILQARGNVSGVDITRLQSSGASNKAITGRLDARFNLQTPARAPFSTLLNTARGSIDIDVRDGRMPGIEVIRQAVIRFANRAQPAPAVDATDAFSRLETSLALQNGSARIGRLDMKAVDFDLTGNGILSVPDGRIALSVEVTLTEALSQQAGRDLYRYAREGQRIVLPATIGGTLSEPTASIDVAQAAGRALKNRIEDEARSILDRAFRRSRPDRKVP